MRDVALAAAAEIRAGKKVARVRAASRIHGVISLAKIFGKSDRFFELLAASAKIGAREH